LGLVEQSGFKAGRAVKKLTIQNGEVFSGEVADQFKAAEPFEFLPASL